MERLKHLKETIMCCVEGACANIQQADTKELGEAIDMIKDLEEAMYYATITKVMLSNEEKFKEREVMYYPYPMYNNGGKEDYYNPPRDMDRYMGKMYYSEGMRQEPRNTTWQDSWEGRAPKSRRTYMEAKHNRHGKEAQMKELETYMQELTADIAEMIQDSSPEEKQLMQKKIAALAEKVGKINV